LAFSIHFSTPRGRTMTIEVDPKGTTVKVEKVVKAKGVKNKELKEKVISWQTDQPFTVVGCCTVTPFDKDASYSVEVHGFHEQEGGEITSSRFSPGKNIETMVLTEENDPDLHIGLSGVIVDGVLYQAGDGKTVV